MVAAYKLTKNGYLQSGCVLNNFEIAMMCRAVKMPVSEVLKDRKAYINIYDETCVTELATFFTTGVANSLTKRMIEAVLKTLNYDFSNVITIGSMVNPNIAKIILDEGFVLYAHNSQRFLMKPVFVNEDLGLSVNTIVAIPFHEAVKCENILNAPFTQVKEIDERMLEFTGLKVESFFKEKNSEEEAVEL